MATQLLQVNAITKVIQYQGMEKTIPDSYWTSDIVPAIYPTWDADKDKLVLFAWYDNNSYMCQRRKYVMNFKTNTFEWKDYEMEQVDDGSGQTLYNKFKDTFFLVDSLATVEYQNEFAKIYAATAATSWLTVRLSRNFLLDETDWVFVEDSGVSADDKELYKTYRKKLRDLPADANTTDAAAVKFPINPQYFKDIYLKKNASATYLGDDGQFVKLSEHYGTTFREKMTAYLIVRSMTDGVYNKTFMSALKTAGMVYDPNESVVKYGETLAGYTTEEVNKTKDYLTDLINKINEEQA
tara:strand:- start:665 stop:1552 length:888 start_codon:yes stop_codon:yes gene_type:complete